MSRNYPQRPQTVVQKMNFSKLQAPGFNFNNVTLDEETQSPRFMSSYEKSGLRKLLPHEKKMYYDHLKSKEDREKHEKNIVNINSVNINLDKFKQQAKNDIRKNVRLGFGEFSNAKDRLLNNKKHIHQDNYGLANYKKEQAKQEAKLGDSMSESTLKFIEKVAMEQKSQPQSSSNSCNFLLLATQVTQISQESKQTAQFVRKMWEMMNSSISQILQKKDEESKQTAQFVRKMWEMMNSSISQILQKKDEESKQTAQFVRKIWEMMNSSSSSKSQSSDNQLLRQQLKQKQQKITKFEAQKASLSKQLENLRRNYQSLTLKYQDSLINARQISANYEKLTFTLKKRQDELRKSQQSILQYKRQLQEHSSIKVQNQAKRVKSILFCSQTAIDNDLESFLKTQIQKFTGKIIHKAKLIYQKDEWNTNITNYLQKPSNPLLFIFKSAKGSLFGAFTQGIQTIKSKRPKQEGTRPFSAFLFNASAGTVFMGQLNPKHVCGVSYYDSYLRFGNNQLGFKNHNLAIMNFSGSSVFGEKFYNIPKRHQLTGEESEIVEISTFQILQVFLL